MFFYTIYILVILLLITQNIILLNEESLILICFCAFCWLSYKNIGDSVSSMFDEKAVKIQKEITNSTAVVVRDLKKNLSSKNQFLTIFKEFKSLGSNTLKFVEVSANFLTTHKKNLSKIPFPKRLLFVSRLEKQTAQLLTLVIIKKLKIVVEAKQFYEQTLPIPYFECINKVSMLEYIKTIKN